MSYDLRQRAESGDARNSNGSATQTVGKQTLVQMNRSGDSPVQLLGPSAGDIAVAPGPIPRDKLEPVIREHRAARPHQTTADPSSRFGTAVMDLWTWCSTNIPNPSDMQTYAASPVDDTVKQRTIGLLAARRARLEFLLGWLLQGGVQSNNTDWETYGGSNAEGTDSSSNAGPIVSEYSRGTTRSYGLRNHDWCGMFVGFAYGRVGMPERGVDPASNPHNDLSSATEARNWINNPGRTRQNGEQTILPEQLAAGARPQAGDLAVFRDHVSMIEDYDASTGVISTVDGNVGLHRNNMSAGVSGFAADTTALQSLHGGLWMLWRPGLESFGAAATAPGAATADNSAGDALVQQLDNACRQLIAVYRGQGIAGGVAEGRTVAAMAEASP